MAHGETTPTAGLTQPAAVLDAWQHAVAAIPGQTKLTGRRLVGISCWSRGLACHLILEHGEPAAVAATVAQPAQVTPAPPARNAAAPRAQVGSLGNGHRTPSHSRLPAQAGVVHAASARSAVPAAAVRRLPCKRRPTAPHVLGRGTPGSSPVADLSIGGSNVQRLVGGH